MTPATKNRVTLLKAGMNPTMVSSRPAQALSPTQFPLLQNVRSRYGVLEARKSETAWSFTGLPSNPEIVGATTSTWFGAEWVILAIRNGTDVDIYDSPDGHAFTKVGQSANATNIFPLTALNYANCITNGVAFQSIYEPVVTDGGLISDGVSVVHWSPNLNAPERYHVRPVTPFAPTEGFAKECSITGDLGGYLYDGSSVGLISGGTSGPTFIYAEPAPVGGNQPAVTIAIAATQADGNTVSLNFTNAVPVSVGKQFAMLVSTPDANNDIFRNCKVDLYVGATPYTIHDPSGTDYNECSLDNFSDQSVGTVTSPRSLQLYAWSIQNNTISGSVSKVVFTYKGATNRYPTANTFELMAVGISGNGVAGIPNYAVSYFDNRSGAESASVVLNSERASGRLLTYLTSTGIKYVAFPLSFNLRMNWTVQITPVVPPSNYSNINLYRKDPGSSSYLYASVAGVADWTGSAWATIGSNVIVDAKDETGLDPERPAPTAYNTVPIGFTCAAFANNRLFFGRKSEYQFSEYRFPMRFSQGVRLDDQPFTAGGFKFANESPKAFAPMIGDLNLDRLAMFTDKGTYLVSGFDSFALMHPSRLSQFGTQSSKSVVTRRDSTYLLDDARHLRSLPNRSGLESESFDVKDVLDGIPAPPSMTYGVSKAVGAFYDDRYHVFYCANGDTTNKTAFVVDLISGTLVQDTYSVGIVCTFSIAGKLVLVKTDGTATQLESGISDVTISVKTRELVTDGDSWLMERQRVYSDCAAGKNLTMTWTGYPLGNSMMSVIPLDSVSGSVRVDVLSKLGIGLVGRSIQAGLAGTVPGGMRLYEWEFETEARVSQGTV